MEIEIWPRMIASAHRRGVPLFMCNAQYPLKSLERDRARAPIRAELMTGFAGAFVKSDLQAARFAVKHFSKPGLFSQTFLLTTPLKQICHLPMPKRLGWWLRSHETRALSLLALKTNMGSLLGI
jgi:hypothetical protein